VVPQDRETPRSLRLRRPWSFWTSLWAHRWFALAVALTIGFGAWQIARVAFGPAVVVDAVRRGALIQTVVASGHVETPFRVDIGAQITGIVQDVLVEEGQRVKQGQPLVAIESSELNAAVVQARGAVAQAEARVRQMDELTSPSARASMAEAQANLQNATNTFNRTSDLELKGAATRAALDDAQKALDVAKAQARNAELQVFTSSPGGSDYVMARTQLDQARANLDTAMSRLRYATIASPRDGVLISRSVERGTVVQPGKSLLVLAPDGETQLVLQIDERNLGLIAVGQSAIASADAFPDNRFPARVSYINPGVDISRASVQVKLIVPDPPVYLRQDMTVSVDIEVARQDNSLVLPTRSLHDGLSSAPWVMGVTNGRARKIPVRVGLRGVSQAEILDGINEGDLAIPATAGVLIGQRLRPIAP
jgi:HlyD family secretion protein